MLFIYGFGSSCYLDEWISIACTADGGIFVNCFIHSRDAIGEVAHEEIRLVTLNLPVLYRNVVQVCVQFYCLVRCRAILILQLLHCHYNNYFYSVKSPVQDYLSSKSRCMCTLYIYAISGRTTVIRLQWPHCLLSPPRDQHCPVLTVNVTRNQTDLCHDMFTNVILHCLCAFLVT